MSDVLLDATMLSLTTWILLALLGWNRARRFFGRVTLGLIFLIVAPCALGLRPTLDGAAISQLALGYMVAILAVLAAKGYALYRRGRRIVARATRKQTSRKVRLDLPAPRSVRGERP
jgi:O-antigen/teichoic acid export membrane protein